MGRPNITADGPPRVVVKMARQEWGRFDNPSVRTSGKRAVQTNTDIAELCCCYLGGAKRGLTIGAGADSAQSRLKIG